MQISSLDLKFLVKELQSLIDAKVDKIYQSKNDILFQLYQENKKLLRITPSLIYLAQEKIVDDKPTNFCMYLRKYLHQARIKKITQYKFERIIEVILDKKEQYILIIELFSKGNVILCDENYKIMQCLNVQKMKSRKIMPKETYHFPSTEMKNIFEINKKDLSNIDKESIVKYLAINFGLGGKYAEEICSRAKVNKNKKELNQVDISNILQVIKQLKEIKYNPNIVDSEVNSFDLVIYKDKEKHYFSTLSEAIDLSDKSVEVKIDKSLEKLNTILKKQKQQIENMELAAEEEKIKADIIYKNYAYLDELFKTIEKAKEKKISWDEIKKKLKTKGIILDNQKITLDLE